MDMDKVSVEKTVTIRRRHRPKDYTDLPNRLIEDNRLSWKALGLLTYLLHLPHDWKLNLAHLSSRREQHGTKRTATASALRQLQETGYLTIVHERDNWGRYSSVIWVVSDEPEFGESQRQEPNSPQSDFPTTVFPTSEKQPLQKKNLNKKKILQTPPSPPPKRGASEPAPAGSGGGGGGGKEKERPPAPDPDTERLIQDELEGRQEAAARGEAPPISNVAAWLAKLRERAAAGENITTEHGKRIRARREAEEKRRKKEAEEASRPKATSAGLRAALRASGFEKIIAREAP